MEQNATNINETIVEGRKFRRLIDKETNTWESILYDRSYNPFPYKIFKYFDESFIRGLPYLSDDFIRKILCETV